MGRIVGLWIVLGAVAEIEEPLAYGDGNEPTGVPTARLVLPQRLTIPVPARTL